MINFIFFHDILVQAFNCLTIALRYLNCTKQTVTKRTHENVIIDLSHFILNITIEYTKGFLYMELKLY